MQMRRLVLCLRWLLAGGCLYLALRLFASAMQSEMLGAFGRCVFGMAGLIASVVIVAPEFIPWIASPFLRLLDTIYLPSATEPPPVDYTLARFYRKRGRLDEAVQEYEKIVHYHPREVAAYAEGIQAAFEAGDAHTAARLYKKGRRYVRGVEPRNSIQRAYETGGRASLA
jgi:tetratricopeptide (TPR) repeat protein